MELSDFEKKVLRCIEDFYSHPWAEADAESPLEQGERSLPSRAEIKMVLLDASDARIDEAIGHLIRWQCVCEVALYPKGSLRSFRITPSRVKRLEPTGGVTPIIAYQITSVGKDAIAGALSAQLQKSIRDGLIKVAGEKIALALFSLVALTLACIGLKLGCSGVQEEAAPPRPQAKAARQ